MCQLVPAATAAAAVGQQFSRQSSSAPAGRGLLGRQLIRPAMSVGCAGGRGGIARVGQNNANKRADGGEQTGLFRIQNFAHRLAR